MTKLLLWSLSRWKKHIKAYLTFCAVLHTTPITHCFFLLILICVMSDRSIEHPDSVFVYFKLSFDVFSRKTQWNHKKFSDFLSCLFVYTFKWTQTSKIILILGLILSFLIGFRGKNRLYHTGTASWRGYLKTPWGATAGRLWLPMLAPHPRCTMTPTTHWSMPTGPRKLSPRLVLKLSHCFIIVNCYIMDVILGV